MNAERQLFEKYHGVGVLEGEELLLRLPDALNFINDCEGLGLTILGLDFYRQVGDDIVENSLSR